MRQVGANPRGGAPGQFISIPYASDGATVYKSALTQIAQRAGKEAPTINVGKITDIPIPGGTNYFPFPDTDAHDGQGTQSVVAQLILAPPRVANSWQITIFQLKAPPQVMADERATVAAIFPNYSRNSAFVNCDVNRQIVEGIEQTNQFVAEVQRT